MSCALWGKPSFLILCPWKTTCWILHASFLSGKSPQFACYYILSEESTLEFSNVMCLVGKALWVSCVMTFVLKENPLSFSCYVLCAEGKPSQFFMLYPLCWRKALWVSHLISFVLKENPGTWESEYWNWMTSWERTLLKSWQRQELFKRSIDCWTWLD